jgi:hypothetical protein
MDPTGRTRATRHIRAFEPPSPAVRWDLYLLAVLALLGVFAHSTPRG